MQGSPFAGTTIKSEPRAGGRHPPLPPGERGSLSPSAAPPAPALLPPLPRRERTEERVIFRSGAGTSPSPQPLSRQGRGGILRPRLHQGRGGSCPTARRRRARGSRYPLSTTPLSHYSLYATPVTLYCSAVCVAVDLDPLRSDSPCRKLTVTTVCRFCVSRYTSIVMSRRKPCAHCVRLNASSRPVSDPFPRRSPCRPRRPASSAPTRSPGCPRPRRACPSPGSRWGPACPSS